MRDFIRQLRQAAATPPHRLVAKAGRKLRQRREDHAARRHDLHTRTYHQMPGADDAANLPLARLITSLDLDAAAPHCPAISELTGRVFAHEFDLLGSGWTHVVNTHGLQVTEPNRAEAERVAALIPAGYEPIDWHIDFKSKQRHRWDPLTWYRDQPQVVGKGIDVKLPWELSRMQHLPLLAWGYALSGASGVGHGMPEAAERYLDEFRNQVLDFIAHNPPRFGINWNCAMDVGIRVAGWVLTLDLFRAAGAAFDDAFLDVFARSVREHADHLAANLEWDEHIRGNHYLADVAGLLVASAYLPAGVMADSYLHFAARELLAETLRQFHPDGSNFEASTSYHRLSAEMVVYGLAVLQGVTPGRSDALLGDRWHPFRPGKPSPPLSRTVSKTGTDPVSLIVSLIPPEVIDRVARMGRFTEDLLDRHGRDPQIGDNDNGRFFKLLPPTMRDAGGCLREDTRNHRHLIDAVEGFFSIKGTVPFTPNMGTDPVPLESTVVGSILDGAVFLRPDLPPFADHVAYPGMGLYLYRHGRLTTIVRCGEVGQNGHGGHAHDDQLTFVLYADGEPVVIDSGTGEYTADVELRNWFRSAATHNAPRSDGHGSLSHPGGIAGLFTAKQLGSPRVALRSETYLACIHDGFGIRCQRVFDFLPDRLDITDRVATRCPVSVNLYYPSHCAPDSAGVLRIDESEAIAVRIEHSGFDTCRGQGAATSPGYGTVVRSTHVDRLSCDHPMSTSLRLTFSMLEQDT